MTGKASADSKTSTKRTDIFDFEKLQEPYFDKKIWKDPPRWQGPSFAGKAYSDATPEYLDSLAGFLDWRSEQDEKKGEEARKAKNGQFYWYYDRKDAKIARTWAAAKRAGQAPVKGDDGEDSSLDGDDGASDEIPF